MSAGFCVYVIVYQVLFFGFLWRKKQSLHAFAFTLRRFLHGAMQGVWREMHVPHRFRRWKTMQQRNRNWFSNRLVAPCKTVYPHKETGAKNHWIFQSVSNLLAKIATTNLQLYCNPEPKTQWVTHSAGCCCVVQLFCNNY